MLKKLLLLAAALCAGAAWAAVEANTATEAELDSLKGVGPALSGRILKERASAPFASWPDFIGRVGGVGPRTAARLSQQGLTVHGQPFDASASSPGSGSTSQRAP